jgi:hypothetical protein
MQSTAMVIMEESLFSQKMKALWPQKRKSPSLQQL